MTRRKRQGYSDSNRKRFPANLSRTFSTEESSDWLTCKGTLKSVSGKKHACIPSRRMVEWKGLYAAITWCNAISNSLSSIVPVIRNE